MVLRALEKGQELEVGALCHHPKIGLVIQRLYNFLFKAMALFVAHITSILAVGTGIPHIQIILGIQPSI